MAGYLRPSRLDDALSTLAEGGWTVLAGGTDHYPARVHHVPDENILDITGISELRGVSISEGGVRIGAATTWTDVIEADLPRACDGLKQAAREVGGVQIQNRGTLGGNLCNASPAADGVPALLSLDAEVELAGVAGSRRLPLSEFVLGNRKTARRSDELLTALHLPAEALEGCGRFLKLGARRYLVISIVMVAGTLSLGADGRIARARLAVGACSAAARRLDALETALVGAPLEEAAALVTAERLSDLSPIDDARGDAAYRRDVAVTLTRRCVGDCLRDLVEAA